MVKHLNVAAATFLAGSCVLGAIHPAEATLFTDQAAFTAAATADGISTTTQGYGAFPLHDLANGEVLGSFQYTFDPTQTQPRVASDGVGGQALGGAPFDVFVGGDSVTLTFTGGTGLRAFGVVFNIAPSGPPVPQDTYQMKILDGAAAGTTNGNPLIPDDSNPNGMTFFLGIIEDPGLLFTGISLSSANDPSFLTPAYQIPELIFGPPAVVPEPASLPLILLIAALAIADYPTRRRRRSNSSLEG